MSTINFMFLKIIIANFKISGYNICNLEVSTMNEYLIKKLKEGRINKNLKQSDVTKLTGIKNTTLSNYENGNTEPDIDTFLKLCDLYELDYVEMLGEAFGYRIPNAEFDIKASEIEHIKKYRNLDDHGKSVVNSVLDLEYKRITADPGVQSARTTLEKIKKARAQEEA